MKLQIDPFGALVDIAVGDPKEDWHHRQAADLVSNAARANSTRRIMTVPKAD